MTTAARLYNLLLLLLTVGLFIAGISRSVAEGSAGVIGALLVPLITGLPTVPALMSLGKNKPRAESFALFVNKAYLFLFAAAAIGFAFKLADSPNKMYVPLLFSGAFFALAFVLNIIVLQKQRAKRTAGA